MARFGEARFTHFPHIIENASQKLCTFSIESVISFWCVPSCVNRFASRTVQDAVYILLYYYISYIFLRKRLALRLLCVCVFGAVMGCIDIKATRCRKLAACAAGSLNFNLMPGLAAGKKHNQFACERPPRHLRKS